jgi:hypothetical protein
MSPLGGPNPQPPANGVVDLSAMREASPEAVAEHRIAQLRSEAMLCQCGERCRDQPHQIFVWRERVLQTPKGLMPAIMSIVVHALDCNIVYELQNQPDLTIFAVRPILQTVWIDEDVALREQIEAGAAEYAERLRAQAEQPPEDAA